MVLKSIESLIERIQTRERPIIFIGQSLGGLIIQEVNSNPEAREKCLIWRFSVFFGPRTVLISMSEKYLLRGTALSVLVSQLEV